MKIQSIKQLKNLKNQRVLLRVDYNVVIEKGKIKEDYRLQASLKTIKWLLAKGTSLIIISHLGQPRGESKELSLRPVAKHLQKLLGRPVKFIPEVLGNQVKTAVAKLKPGEIILLENLRFRPEETSNDQGFAEKLARLADVYVNDALAVSHRAHASVAAIKKYLPVYAGLLLTEELQALDKVVKPRLPLVVIMGGAKIETKAPLIAKLFKSANQILIGGALANNFFAEQGWEVGQSLIDQTGQTVLQQFYSQNKLKSKIILPIDVVVKNRLGRVRLCRPDQLTKSEMILDIGPQTISLFAKYISQAQTLIWNGPMGKFEEAPFKQGTLSIARSVAARSKGRAYGVVGGGETIAALNLTKMAEYVDWVSTAGGALLAYLGGEEMPGL
ncbi:MAG: phosphoglycerate kinase [Patescibacteria group bacterium]